MRQNLKKRAGYTLVEVLIASTIFVSVVGMGIATYTSASGFQSKSSVIRETTQSARYAMDTIVRDIRNADGMGVKAGSTVFNGVALLDDGGGFPAGGAFNEGRKVAAGSIHGIAIYKKVNSTICSNYYSEVRYYMGTKKADGQIIKDTSDHEIKTIYQQVRYIDPANVANTSTISPCNSVQENDILSDRVQLVYNDSMANSFGISGLDSRAPSGSADEGATKITIKIKVQPVNADMTKSEESRVIELETTAVPRNLSL